MKRAIISGATGAIGTALIQELMTRDIEVLVLCREDSERISNIPQNPLVTVQYCALSDLANLDNENDEEYDAFFHLAWDGTTGEAREDMYRQNQNVRYALDAVKAAARFHCKVFVGAGSQAEYGRVSEKLTARTPAFPETGYGIAKLCAGQMTRKLAHQLGMRHIWMRVLSVYGVNDNERSLVMSVINAIKNGEIPKCTKGEQQWDYLYSGDAAEAFYLAAKNGKDGKIYVLGGGKTHLLSEYISEMRDAVNPEQEIAWGAISYSPNQVMYLCADIDELKSDTGWKPKTEFADGIRALIKKNP